MAVWCGGDCKLNKGELAAGYLLLVVGSTHT